MEQLAWNPPRGRGSLWVNEHGGVVDRTERSTSSRSVPRASIFAGVDRLVPGGQARTVQGEKDGVPVLWAKAKNRTMSSCCGSQPAAAQVGTPGLFAGLESKRTGGGAANGRNSLWTQERRDDAEADAECACEAPAQPKTGRRNTKNGPHQVSGTWLAAVLQLDADEAAEIADHTVELDGTAWSAVRAILETEPSIQSLSNRITRRRARIWSSDGTHVESNGFGPPIPVERRAGLKAGPLGSDHPRGPLIPVLGGSCDCAVAITSSARFVDSVAGLDSNSGRIRFTRGAGGLWSATVEPWKTLSQVQTWLNTDVYGTSAPATTCLRRAWVFLLCGSTWDGTEDAGSGTWSEATLVRDAFRDQAALFITGVKGVGSTECGPLSWVIMSAYGDPTNGLPIIDGSEGGPPQYQDKRIGILVRDCCRLAINNITVRGFGTGIDVRGSSYDHIYSGLTIKEHGITGLRIGVREPDISDYGTEFGLSDADAATYMAYGGTGLPDRYPEQIAVNGCTFSSIGYDTEGGDVALNFLATNCTISNNDLSGDADRGVDGIVSQLGSSGHLIEGNTIHEHNKYCYAESTDKAVLVASGACSGDYVLYQSCVASVSCLLSGFNYHVQSYTSSFTLPAGEEAFAEDGIDLKGVKQRTGRSDATTVIRNNVIYGQTVSRKTGITISDGTEGVHIYNNRIFLNSVGIFVTNTKNSNTYYVNTATSGVYIYRNLIYMNLGEGILIKSQDDSSDVYTVDGVYIINNTIAHNLYTGVLIANNTGSSATASPPDVDNIYLYNNLIARNGIGGTYDDSRSRVDALQVAWDGQIELSGGAISFGSDYNCYLGWERESDGTDERVIGAGVGSDFKPRTVTDSQTSTRGWSIETSGGVQALTIASLYLTDGSALDGFETSPGGDTGDQFLGFLQGLDPASTGSIDGLDYSPTDILSPCVDSAWDGSGAAYGAYHEDTGLDIAVSADFAGNPNAGAAPDIGALEMA